MVEMFCYYYMVMISNFYTLFVFSMVAHIVCESDIFINKFTVKVKPEYDHQDHVNKLARDHGFVNLGKIGNLDGYYSFEHERISKRSTSYSHHHHNNLKTDYRVLMTEQQKILKRSKRLLKSVDEIRDPLFERQWYLNKGSIDGYDMKVVEAWKKGYTGKGVVVSILDDGIQPNHPDLKANYDPLASYDINDNDADPTPQDNGDNKHGTRCAGEVAAIAGNNYCGAGVAYNSSIGGVRMLDGLVTDEVEARALSLNPDHIDIFSASWGPEDDGKTVDGPGRLAKRAFIDGIKKGRGGKGSIFVWASGNGGRRDDNCNCDGYTNSIYTLSISSATQSGTKPWYLEECSSTLATTYSSGTSGQDENIVTCDVDFSFIERERYGLPIDQNKLCTDSHTGTSASAPIAAGICALALEANPNLTWRDMQYIVLMTSRSEPLMRESGWSTNSVGRNFSHKFGFGLMDAEAMVDLARRWRPLPLQKVCETQVRQEKVRIPAGTHEQLEVFINDTGCEGSISEVKYLEHVQARIYLEYKPRGALKISLISPSGTVSDLLKPRIKDINQGRFFQWPFLSVHFWGESPRGTWKLIIKNDLSDVDSPGSLLSWGMTFYGINETLPNYKDDKDPTLHIPRDSDERTRIMYHCLKRGKFYQSNSSTCVDSCPPKYYPHLATYSNERMNKKPGGYCNPCNSNCAECYGPAFDNCISCNEEYLYYDDQCVSECPPGYFANAKLNECLPCSPLCKTCENDAFLCKSCYEGFELKKNNCFTSCKDKDKCFTCPSNCYTCDHATEACIICKAGFKLLDGKCIEQSCPVNYYENIIEDKYIYRKNVKMISPIQCSKCHHSCSSCSGPSHSNCQTCYDNITLHNGLCISCPKGEYYNHELNGCDLCDNSCASCKNSKSSDCTSCKPPMRLHHGHCVPCCSLTNQIVSKESHHSFDCCSCDKSSEECILTPDDDDNNNYNDEKNIPKMRNQFQKVVLLYNLASQTVIILCLSSFFIVIILLIFFQIFIPKNIFSSRNYRDYKIISDCDVNQSGAISLAYNDKDENEKL